MQEYTVGARNEALEWETGVGARSESQDYKLGKWARFGASSRQQEWEPWVGALSGSLGQSQRSDMGLGARNKSHNKSKSRVSAKSWS